METEKLLIEIQAMVQCQYLSDLHTSNTLYDTSARQRILAIPDTRYSTTAWSEAVSYITGKPSTHKTISEAKKAIVKNSEHGRGRLG